MTNDLIQTLWIGDRLGSMEQLCLRSFLRHAHRVRLYAYEDVQGVPEGVEIARADEILPPGAIFRTRQGSYANFADVFRYRLLADRGGWWVDCDVVCLRPWSVEMNTIVSATDEKGHGRMANVFVLKAPAGSALMEECFRASERLGEKRFIFAQTGPFLMHTVIRARGDEHRLMPPHVFAPVPWNAAEYFTASRPFIRHLFHWKNLLRRRHLVPRFSRRTLGMHLWSGMWDSSKLDRNRRHVPSSIYGQLQRADPTHELA